MISGPNWARRYGPHHRRLCARPGCGAPAAATLRFQPTQREAWLVDLDDDDARTEGDLCARHAAGLVLPRGWQLHNDFAAGRDDAHEPSQPAERARASVARASVARARRRRMATGAVQLPGLSAVEVPDTATRREPAIHADDHAPENAPLVAPASPEESEALAETLDAQTPLLRRAFRNVSLPDDDA